MSKAQSNVEKAIEAGAAGPAAAAVIRRHENAAAAATGGAVSNSAAAVTTAEQDREFQTYKRALVDLIDAPDSDNDAIAIGYTVTRALVKAAISSIPQADRPANQVGKIRAGVRSADDLLARVEAAVLENLRTVGACMARPGDTLPGRFNVGEWAGHLLGIREVSSEVKERMHAAAAEFRRNG